MCAHHAGVISRLIEKPPDARKRPSFSYPENIQLMERRASHLSISKSDSAGLDTKAHSREKLGVERTQTHRRPSHHSQTSEYVGLDTGGGKRKKGKQLDNGSRKGQSKRKRVQEVHAKVQTKAKETEVRIIASSIEDLDHEHKDEDEEEKDDSNCTCCNKFKSVKGTCFVVLYLWLAVLLMLCLSALIVIILFIVRPYMHAETFIPTQCEAISTVPSQQKQDCSCGKGCSSSFPCLEIVVVFDAIDDKRKHRSFLREHETALSTMVSHYKHLFYTYFIYIKGWRCENRMVVGGES